MKTLLIVRHAKSSWDDASMKDFDRPLNDRGRRDAPDMAERLQKAGVHIDLFVSSPAKRARKTAELFMEVYGRKVGELVEVQPLYHPEIQAFREAIADLDDSLDTVAIFSHNPGITAFANILSTVRVDDMPTCAVFSVRSDVAHWKDFIESKPTFWFFDYPKAGKD